MSDPVEAAYIAVERAYGEGRFDAALKQARALQPQLEVGRPDQLSLRLQLLIGHIHYHGLQQPSEAAVAYGLVLEQTPDSTYRALASQGLELCRRQISAPESMREVRPGTAPEPPEAAELPATPWLSRLADPERALEEIRAAWSTAVPSPHRGTAARLAAGTANVDAPVVVFAEAELAPASPADRMGPEVLESLEEPDTPVEPPADSSPAEQEPALPVERDASDFSAEEWADLTRGLLLVELSSQAGAMR